MFDSKFSALASFMDTQTAEYNFFPDCGSRISFAVYYEKLGLKGTVIRVENCVEIVNMTQQQEYFSLIL